MRIFASFTTLVLNVVQFFCYFIAMINCKKTAMGFNVFFSIENIFLTQ